MYNSVVHTKIQYNTKHKLINTNKNIKEPNINTKKPKQKTKIHDIQNTKKPTALNYTKIPETITNAKTQNY